MGDQQEIAKLSWLAGITDGEGTIGLYRYQESNGKLRVKPRVQWVTTSWRLAEGVQGVLKRYLGINPHIMEHEQRPTWKPKIQIALTSFSQCRDVLQSLLPYLVEKAPQARILLPYLEWRIGKQGHAFSDDDRVEVGNALRALKEINFRGRNFPRLASSSETTRGASANDADGDMVQSFTET